MNRRNMALSGVAAVAAAAGAGFAWYRSQGEGPGNLPGVAGSGGRRAPGLGSASDAAVAAFWASTFETPDGLPLPIKSLQGKALLLNFWATWCPPCVEELPLLNQFFEARRARGWQVLGLAVDQPSAVRKWLQQKPLAFPVGMVGFGGTELSKSLGNGTGSLPFSVVFNSAGQIAHRKIGKVEPEDLARWVSLQ